MTPTATPDYAAIKSRQNAAWASGDYARIGTTLQIVGETLAEAMDLRPAQRVLDVAAGNGNATLAFARRWCEVTSTDYVETLLARGRARAEAEGLTSPGRWRMPSGCPSPTAASMRCVSTFGVMFAPDQATAAASCCGSAARAGGSAWRTGRRRASSASSSARSGRHVPPPAGVKSPALWGSRPWIEESFGAGARDIVVNDRAFIFRYRSPEHFIEVFRTWYGPVHKAFLALDAGRAGGADRRPARPDRAVQHGDRRHDAGALGLWRDRHHHGLKPGVTSAAGGTSAGPRHRVTG